MAIKKNDDFSIVLYKRGDETFELTNKGLYQIVSKLDTEAPDGFQEFRTTKVLDPDAGAMTVNLAVWDEDRNMWDTGMTEYSAALMRLQPDATARKILLSSIKKHILEPMIALKQDVFDPHNNEFWDNESFTLTLDHVFNTERPDHLYVLFLLVLHGNLAPKEFESDPAFRLKASYSVENKESVIDLKHRKELEVNEATATFFTMLKTQKAELMALLEFLKISSGVDTDDALLNSIFTRWLKDDVNQNPKAFLKGYDSYIESPSGKEELQMFANLTQLRREGKVKQSFNKILFNGDEIGDNMRDAARKVLADQTLKEEILKLL